MSPAYWSCYPADPTYATACVEFPWIVSHYYDDKKIIEESLDAMTKWVDYLGSQEDEDGIVSFGLFGDWCPPMHAIRLILHLKLHLHGITVMMRL